MDIPCRISIGGRCMCSAFSVHQNLQQLKIDDRFFWYKIYESQFFNHQCEAPIGSRSLLKKWLNLFSFFAMISLKVIKIQYQRHPFYDIIPFLTRNENGILRFVKKYNQPRTTFGRSVPITIML
jgi:hypothetical protein